MYIICRFYKNEDGRFTLEAAIIMPVVIFLVAAVVYFGMFLYQKVTVQACAEQAADTAAASWFSYAGLISDDGLLSGSIGLYRRIFDSSEDEKLKKAELTAERLLNKRGLLKPSAVRILASVEQGFFTKKIAVSIKCCYPLPLLRAAGIFQVKREMTIEYEAVSVIKEPAELIRNTDFVIELEKDLEAEFPGIREFREKLTAKIKKVRECINP